MVWALLTLYLLAASVVFVLADIYSDGPSTTLLVALTWPLIGVAYLSAMVQDAFTPTKGA